MKEIVQHVSIFSLPVMVGGAVFDAARSGELMSLRAFRRVRSAWRDWSLMRDIAISEREFAEGKCKQFTTIEDMFK